MTRPKKRKWFRRLRRLAVLSGLAAAANWWRNKQLAENEQRYEAP